jgi:hypothetical protein
VDYLFGGFGQDTLIQGAGSGVIHGGPGFDLCDIAGSSCEGAYP